MSFLIRLLKVSRRETFITKAKKTTYKTKFQTIQPYCSSSLSIRKSVTVCNNFTTNKLRSYSTLLHLKETIATRKKEKSNKQQSGSKKGKRDVDDEDEDYKQTAELDLTRYGNQFKATIDSMMKIYTGLQVGRAEPSLLENIKIGSTPISKFGSISLRDRMALLISLFDPSSADKVVRALREAELGLNPTVDGPMIIVNIPKPTQEFRDSLIKKASDAKENAKSAVRRIRKDAMDDLKKLNKPKDEDKRLQNDIQKLVDQANKKIDDAFKQKENDIKKA
eukprot:TRINITY_DN7554_c0_g1_i1.p2 TRINITY_DN7554_c0_g1~~TRINITY_DN7554_c0_g1_i1.p2  ORF type:complete len:279 (-),score=54.29 TRINITY_DN7554_c0_g1_i1:948-1784(-)